MENQNVTEKYVALQKAVDDKACPPLLNSMGILPSGVFFDVKNYTIEKCVYQWLKAQGVDQETLNGLLVRVVTKAQAATKNQLSGAINNSGVPFVVVLFVDYKRVKKQQNNNSNSQTKEYSDAMQQVRQYTHGLPMNNTFDNCQMFLGTEDSVLNKAVAFLNGGKVEWKTDKRFPKAHTILNPDSILAICFGIPLNDLNRYHFMIDTKAQNREQGGGFIVRTIIQMAKPKNKVKTDPMSYLR